MIRNLGYLVILAIAIYIAVRRLRNRESGNREADEISAVDCWRCAQCNESVPEAFHQCWSCGRVRDPEVNQNAKGSDEGQTRE